MCYLVPRSDVAVTEIWAALALGWRWSFTVCQPGLGIVAQVSMGGLKEREQGNKEGGGEQSSVGEKQSREGGVERRAAPRVWDSMFVRFVVLLHQRCRSMRRLNDRNEGKRQKDEKETGQK